MRFFNKTLIVGATLFVVFVSYYYMTSNILPIGAGPDYGSHNDVTMFIYKHNRLPSIPRDEDELSFTAYGGTRALRPPLSYIVSALLAKILPVPDVRDDRWVAFRKGSALLSALAVWSAFYALFVYFKSYKLALFGASLIGLMPQFAFIASYNNDDSGGIFSATFLLMTLVIIFRRGINIKSSILFGVASGLVIISKPTAWLLFPSVILFIFLFIRVKLLELAKYTTIVLAISLLVGGWWIVFNIYNYGWTDPINQNITRKMADKYSRFPADHEFGYQAQGAGFRALLKNHDNFIAKTYKSTIGNLDWLRIRIAEYHYRFYLTFFFVGIGYFVLRFLRYIYALSRAFSWQSIYNKTFLFESILVFSLGFQFYMYVWSNIYKDIQTQGKYLIPVFLSLLIISLSGFRSIGKGISALLDRIDFNQINLSKKGILNIVFSIGLLSVLILHIDAIVNYVIPFYRPPLHQINLYRFEKLDITKDQISGVNQISELIVKGGTIKLRSEGIDPWIMMDSSFCKYFDGNKIVRVKLESDAKGEFSIYWDEGDGFSESRRSRMLFRSGYDEIYIGVSTRNCAAIRLDPRMSPGYTRIHDIAISHVDIDRRLNYRLAR